MEIIMERQSFKKKVAYKTAKKRVEKIRNFWLFFFAYLLIVVLLKSTNIEELWFQSPEIYTNFWIVLQGVLLGGYGIYLYVPSFRNWERKKISALMDKEMNRENKDPKISNRW